MSNKISGWIDGSRLIISASLQFEAGGAPDTGFDNPFPQNMKPGFPDLPAKTWFQYGYKEGIPRLLDLLDKHGIKVTSHTIGLAAIHSPALAKEIAARGHELSGHGQSWTDQFALGYEEEKEFIRSSKDAIQQITGQETVGYNCYWMRRSPNTLAILQELGFTYYIDDLSRDEPFLVSLNNERLVVVPYTLRCNDIYLLEGKNYTPNQYLETLKLEFDQLYHEGATRRRMMSFSMHDRISGTPAMVNVLDQFISYTLRYEGVRYLRKDEIASMTLTDKNSITDADYV
ncbi:polysaccharide deacetylase family protein [Taibaiella soli]|uniref:Polysaccharide deacetylase n=1 Tax=Taibaiella soli TaxID=1649169 RepID=A0A2W2AXI0_9BACT|nr:polysaccharide deacetylase family protein [Taibaiella soli]PZF72704.1 polysaccharide deacetylase [Taibaiella soli]